MGADLRDFNDLPCQDPLRMDDWFIPKDGKLANEEIADVAMRVDDWIHEHIEDLKDLSHNELDELREKRITQAVKAEEAEGRRRRAEAIRSCYLDCPMVARLLCLDEGIKNPEHGIWGGYPELERRQIAAAVRSRGKNTRTAAKAMIDHERQDALRRHRIERAAAALNAE
jgi:hypothetical protein